MVCAKVRFRCNTLSIIPGVILIHEGYCYGTVFSSHFYCISRGGFKCLLLDTTVKKKKKKLFMHDGRLP